VRLMPDGSTCSQAVGTICISRPYSCISFTCAGLCSIHMRFPPSFLSPPHFAVITTVTFCSASSLSRVRVVARRVSSFTLWGTSWHVNTDALGAATLISLIGRGACQLVLLMRIVAACALHKILTLLILAASGLFYLLHSIPLPT